MTATATPDRDPVPAPPARPVGRWLAAAGLGAVALVAVEVVPSGVEVARSWSELDARRDAVRAAGGAAAEVERLRAEAARLEDERAARLGASGPAGSLAVLREAAAASEARLTRVQPAGTAGDGAEVLEVSVEGDGHAVGAFVDAVERSAARGRVSALDVTGPGMQRTDGVRATLTLTLDTPR